MTRAQGIFFGCVGSFVVVCCGGGWLGWRFSDFGRASAELDQAVKDAKAAGLPWVADDLNPRPPVKDSENAAPFISRNVVLMGKDAKTKAALAAFDKARTDSDEAAEAAALKDLGPWLAGVRAAGDRPRCDLHRDWDLGPWLMFPEMATERKMATTLAAAAGFEAKAGRFDDALKDILRTVQIGAHAGSEPTLIGALVQVACDFMAMRTAEQYAEVAHDNQAELAKLQRALAGLGKEIDLHRSLLGEAYMGIMLTRNVSNPFEIGRIVSGSESGAADTPQVPKHIRREGLPRGTFGRIFMCRHLQLWTRVLREIKGVDEPMKISAIMKKIGDAEEHAGWSHIFNRVLFPIYDNVGSSVDRMIAERAATRGLVAVLRYRLKNGRYPKSLQEAGFTETDPFTGNPMRFRLDGKGFRVYSVGPDGQDNNGIRREDMPKNHGTDRGWDVVASFPAYHKPKTDKPPKRR